MPNELKPCKYCGYHSPFFDTHYLFLFLKRYTVSCPDCNYETEKYATHEEAARAWNLRDGEE